MLLDRHTCATDVELCSATVGVLDKGDLVTLGLTRTKAEVKNKTMLIYPTPDCSGTGYLPSGLLPEVVGPFNGVHFYPAQPREIEAQSFVTIEFDAKSQETNTGGCSRSGLIRSQDRPHVTFSFFHFSGSVTVTLSNRIFQNVLLNNLVTPNGAIYDLTNVLSSGLNRLRLNPQPGELSYSLVIDGVVVVNAIRTPTAGTVDLEFNVPGSMMSVGEMTEIDLSGLVPPFRVEVGPQP
jgi:hypothetical protein